MIALRSTAVADGLVFHWGGGQYSRRILALSLGSFNLISRYSFQCQPPPHTLEEEMAHSSLPKHSALPCPASKQAFPDPTQGPYHRTDKRAHQMLTAESIGMQLSPGTTKLLSPPALVRWLPGSLPWNFAPADWDSLFPPMGCSALPTTM